MQRNVELFDRIADAIEKEPGRYDQCAYSTITDECGTAHCIAGWAALLTGAKPYRGHSFGSGVIPPNGKDRVDIDDYAGTALGLSIRPSEERYGCEAWDLFDADWQPPKDETVPAALRRIGRGGAI